MIWRARVKDVRPHDNGLRWTLLSWTSDIEVLVHVDTSRDGKLAFDIQSDGYVGTSGDLELDDAAISAIRWTVANRRAVRQLDALDKRRWGAGPRERLRGAA